MFLLLGWLFAAHRFFSTQLNAGDASSSIGSDGQPEKLYPRPAVKSYVTARFSEVKYLVPTDDSLGTSWREIEFDDTAWSAGRKRPGL